MTAASSSQKEIPAGMIDLGIGQPSPWLLPTGTIARAAAHCGSNPERMLLSSGTGQGDLSFRAALSEFLEKTYAMPVEPAGLLVTNGASQAIDLICTLFSQAGDTILVEEPTYFLARKIFADHRLKPIALPMDADGLIIEVHTEPEKALSDGPQSLYPEQFEQQRTGPLENGFKFRSTVMECFARHGDTYRFGYWGRTGGKK